MFLALVPAGLIAYLAYLAIATGQPLSPFTSQAQWGRHFVPLGGIPLALWGEAKSLAALVGLNPRLAGYVTASAQFRHLTDLAFLVVALLLLRFGWRRLPPAYLAYGIVSVAIAVSDPATTEPLKSFPRFCILNFPLWISLSIWANSRRLLRPLIVTLVPLLALFTVYFVSWTWPP